MQGKFFSLLHLLKHSEIDKQKWDECIASSHNGNIYGLSWYLDAICKNWEAIVEDNYKTVFPLTAKKKYGINYLYQPHFAQQLGIFSREKSYSVENFLNAIPEKFKFIEICINTGNSEKSFNKNLNGFELKKNSNYELQLKNNYKKIYKNYSENTKRNIKKAIKNENHISSENINSNDMIKLFRKNKGKEFSHLKNDYYQTLKSLLEICQKKKYAEIFGAFDKEKKLCAGAIFLIHKGRAVFLFSATNEEAKKNGAMFLLVDNFIKNHSEILSVLDFEGSNDANLARFYKSFGAKETLYLQLKKNNLPKYFRWLKK